MKQLDQVARDLAARGEDAITRVSAIAKRARQILETEDVQPTVAPEHGPYAWEAPEHFPIGAPLQIYLGTIEDFATGEGLTVSFFASRAPTENAFRKSIAREVGVHSADRAAINQGGAASVPFGTMFLSPTLSARLEQIERGEDQAGAFAFFGRWHINYS